MSTVVTRSALTVSEVPTKRVARSTRRRLIVDSTILPQGTAFHLEPMRGGKTEFLLTFAGLTKAVSRELAAKLMRNSNPVIGGIGFADRLRAELLKMVTPDQVEYTIDPAAKDVANYESMTQTSHEARVRLQHGNVVPHAPEGMSMPAIAYAKGTVVVGVYFPALGKGWVLPTA